jgi:hypothetical protein
VGLFGDKEKKKQEEAAAHEAAERFAAMSPKELAAEILPAVAAKHDNQLTIANFLMKPYPRGTSEISGLLQPVKEAIQALEHAGLILVRVQGGTGGAATQASLTRLGETAFEEGDVAKYLDGDAATAEL